MRDTSESLVMHASEFEVRKAQGLWRFYKGLKYIPMHKKGKYTINAKNVKEGKVFVHKGQLCRKEYSVKSARFVEQEWWETDHWAYNMETGEVFHVRMQDGQTVNKKLCHHVVPGTKPVSVLAQILDKDIRPTDEWTSQEQHRRYKDYTLYQTKWCREYDGKSILELVQKKPKMTFAEIKNVIENEGGSVDGSGIIHRD